MSASDGTVLEYGKRLRLAAPYIENCAHADVPTVVQALAALEPVLRPLRVYASLHAFSDQGDENLELREPNWFLLDATARTDLLLDPHEGSGEVREAEVLSSAAVEGFLREAVAWQGLPQDAVVSFDVWIEHTEARLPLPLSTRDDLVLDDDVGRYVRGCVHRREDGRWARACGLAERPPFDLRFQGRGLSMEVFWSPWFAGGVGFFDLQRSVDDLLSRGWRLRDVDETLADLRRSQGARHGSQGA